MRVWEAQRGRRSGWRLCHRGDAEGREQSGFEASEQDLVTFTLAWAYVGGGHPEQASRLLTGRGRHIAGLAIGGGA